MMKALILAQFHGDALARLRQHGEVVCEPWLETGQLADPEELGERLATGGFDVLILEADFAFEETFAAAPGLRFVGVCRGDVGPHVDLDAASARGVVVVNTPARNAVAVAELTIGLMLALVRRIPPADAMIRRGGWGSAVDNLTEWSGTELWGRTAGLVGYGAIGCQVARRLRAFEMRLLAYDPLLASTGGSGGGQVSLVGLGELLACSDFVSLHCPLNAETRGMIGPAELALMKPTAYLINTARAAIVDEAALLSALRERRIAGAGLDVHLVEPLPSRSGQGSWLELDNVVLTPHIGGATSDVVRHHSEMIVADLERWLAGEDPLHLVREDQATT